MLYAFIYYGFHPIASLTAAFLFLSAPLIFMKGGYGPLRAGFALMPVYIFFEISILRNILISNNLKRICCLYIPAIFFVKVFAFFLDPYSYVMATLIPVIYICLILFDHRRNLSTRHGYMVIIFIAINAFTVYLYKLYIPGGATYAVMNLDFFRGQGIDFARFLTPSDIFAFYDLIGIYPQWQDWEFYSIRTGMRTTFPGYGLLIISAITIIMARKVILKNKILLSIIIGSGVALLISMGPSFKIDDRRAERPPVNYRYWQMPAEEATAPLPWSFIYTNVPGIKHMRVLHRWQALVRVGLVIITALAITELLARKRYILVAVILIILIVECFPSIPDYSNQKKDRHNMALQFEKDVIAPLQDDLNPKEKVYFLSTDNDYLSTYIGASVDIRLYNTAGDKNRTILRKHWPRGIVALNRYKKVNRNLSLLFKNNKLDALIIPFFSLRWHSYRWPPSLKEKTKIRAERFSVFDDKNPDIEIIEREWYAIVRPIKFYGEWK